MARESSTARHAPRAVLHLRDALLVAAVLACAVQRAAAVLAPTPTLPPSQPTLQHTWTYVPSSAVGKCWWDVDHLSGLTRGLGTASGGSGCLTATGTTCGYGSAATLPYNTPAQCMAYAEGLGATVASLQYCGECWIGTISYAAAVSNNCMTSTGVCPRYGYCGPSVRADASALFITLPQASTPPARASNWAFPTLHTRVCRPCATARLLATTPGRTALAPTPRTPRQ